MKNNVYIIVRAVLALTCFALSTSQLLAQTTYNYQGQPFTTVNAPYTGADRVSGSFSLPLPLPPSLAMEDISAYLLTYSFVDGVQTRSQGNSTICQLQVSTDALGNISAWKIVLREAPTPALGNSQQTLDLAAAGDLVGEGPAGASACDGFTPTLEASTAVQGSWSNDQIPGSELDYQYSGTAFDTLLVAPYVTGDRISGSIRLGSPLPAYLPLTEINFFLLDFGFQDGVQSRTPANSAACIFTVATDGNGNIIAWRFALRETPLPALGQPQKVLDSSSTVNDLVGEGPAGISTCAEISPVVGAQSSMSGSWTSPLPLGLPTSYDYFGEPLTMADPPWTIGEHISGTILLNEKLPANLPLTDASYVLLDYSFEDGVQTWLPANSLVCEIRVATDGNGSIVDWKISLRQTPIQALGQPQQFLQSYNSVGDLVGEGLAGIGDCDSITATDYARSTNPGTWMQRANAVVTPIPTLSPLALALLGLVLIMVVGLPGTVALGKR